MGDNSKIEWTDATWNPVRGCSVVSEGCRNCYAMQVAARFSGEGLAYEGLAYSNSSGAHWTGKVRMVDAHLEDPIRWRRPRRIFVNSMSDLFHESIPDRWIDRVFAVMATARRHTFQVLTKRPDRMAEYMQRNSTGGHILHVASPLQDQRGADDPSGTWPRPNIWMGVSIEDQKTANERISLLLETSAAVRFISYEPALGPVDLTAVGRWRNEKLSALEEIVGVVGGWERPRLDWVIVGAESGNGARQMDLAWPRQVVQQCKAAGVSVFVKQLGSRPVDWRHDEPEVPPYEYFLSKKGGDIDEWPEDLRVREFPKAAARVQRA